MSLRSILPVPSRPRVLVAVVVVASAFGVGCASEQVRWDDATETVAAAPETAKAATHEKPVSAREYAARFPTDADCDAAVQRLAKRNTELALQLLRVCVERGDFRRLSALTDGNLVTTLVTRPEAPALCARVVAARGGDVDGDVTACQRVGYPVATLEQVFSNPEKAAGKIVIVRAQLDAEHKSKKETRLVEMQLDDREPAPQPTGRRIAAQLGAQVMPPGEAVLLARVVKITDDKLIDDGELVTVIDVIASAPVAGRPTF
jgi:hypothetical protein